MSDQDKLLSRRQILAIFGAGTGTAIVGSTQANLGSDEQGNLYGGTADMAGDYQVGPGLWKGPLSVRSEVPAEDGNDFVQTDAGDDGNLYALHHYNGGWDKQGLSTTSLETEETRSDRSLSGSDGLVEVTDDGVWCWHQNDRAVVGNGTTFLGWVNSSGDIVVGSVDNETQAVQTTTLNSGLNDDDHASPGLELDDSGYLHVAYSSHNGSTLYYRRSSNPHDISSFDAEQSLSPSSQLTYCNPRYDSTTGRLYIIFQDGSNDWRYIYSTDGGSSWSSSTTFLTNSDGGVYLQLDSIRDGRLDMAAYQVGGTPSRQHLYHGYFADGTVYDSGGNSLGSSTDLSNLTQIYDTSASGNHAAQAFDVARVDGTAQITFGVYPQEDEHIYRYATYEGGAWTHRRMVDGGSSIEVPLYRQWNYSGLAHLDREEYGVVFASVGDSESSKIVRLETNDHGQTWYTEDYSTSSKQNVRPVVPANRDEDLPVFWMEGKYGHFDNGIYEMGIVGGRESIDTAGVSASGYRSAVNVGVTSQTVSPGSPVRVQFDDVGTIADAKEEWDSSNHKFVAKDFGWYIIDCSITLDTRDTSATEGRSVAILEGPNGRLGTCGRTVTSLHETTYELHAHTKLEPGDEVYVRLLHDGGVDLDIDDRSGWTDLQITQER